GDLFVPLTGGRADGHQFLEEAFRRGAAAALCARSRLPDRRPGPLVVVEDVTRALQQLAREHRLAWQGLMIGVTGSTGKTTTKDLVARVLSVEGPTLRTEGNLNNHWGVPLTLLRLRPEHRAAVVEVGTNHPGEIAPLAVLARPREALITNVGSAHLEHFGSIEAITREKAELARALPADGVLYLGADSPALIEALRGHPGRRVTYGLSRAADLRAESLENLGPEGTRFEVRGFPPVRLALVGVHQRAGALARQVAQSARGAELWVVGEHARDYAAGARDAGVEVRLFPDKGSLAEALAPALEPGTVVLLKASRGAALEQVLEGLELEA